MTCISRPPRSLQGAGSDEALVRVPGITPRAQCAWDCPQGSRLFAHATDTDDAVTPPTAVSDCLGARAVKNRQHAVALGVHLLVHCVSFE